MSGTKKTIIAIVLVAVILFATSPTFALFTKTGDVGSSTLTTRVYDLSVTSNDNFSVDISSGETFKFGFFAKAAEDDTQIYIDFSNLSTEVRNKMSVYRNNSGSLTALSANDDGAYYDSDEFSSGEARSYLVEISGSAYAQNVRIRVWSEDRKPVIIIPEGGDVVDLPPASEGSSQTILNVETDFIPSSLKQFDKIFYKTREDDGTNVVLTAARYTDSTYTTVEDVLLIDGEIVNGNLTVNTITELDGTLIKKYTNCAVTVWTPKELIIQKATIAVSGNTVVSGLVAEEVIITKGTGNPMLTIDNISCGSLTIADGINGDISIQNLSGINGNNISSLEIGCPNGSEIKLNAVSAIENLLVKGGGGKNYNIVAPSITKFDLDTNGGGSVTVTTDYIGDSSIKTAGGNTVTVISKEIGELDITSSAGANVTADVIGELVISCGGGSTVVVNAHEVTDALQVKGLGSGEYSGGAVTINVTKTEDYSGVIKELNLMSNGAINVAAYEINKLIQKATYGTAFNYTMTSVTSKLGTSKTLGQNDFTAEYAANSDADVSHSFTLAEYLYEKVKLIRAAA